MSCTLSSSLFFFNDTATTEIYTLSLHDALPISSGSAPGSTAPTRPCCTSLSRWRSEEHTSELQSHVNIVCRLLLEKKKRIAKCRTHPPCHTVLACRVHS